MPGHDGKYKGVKGHQRRQGMGRLRRANTSDPTRVGGLERHDEDAEVFDRLGTRQGASNAGETLLARFNRVARSEASTAGEPGEITGFAGAHVLVTANGVEVACTVRQALKKQIKGVKNPLCVGDRVRWARDGDGGVITGIEPRRNQLERADSHNRSLVHVFAANLDCLAVVASLAEPDLKFGLIDRYLVIAAANAIPAAVIINKRDLGDPEPALALYRSLGIAVFATAAAHSSGDPGIAALREHLAGKACVFAGQSGVGKSSLVNALFPEIGARIGAVADAGHGRHTTTSARCYTLSGGVRLIDTPGVRECSITGLEAVDVALLYPEMAVLQPKCHFTDCTHLHEPECAVQAAVEVGQIAETRFESYRSIVEEDLTQGA